MILRTVYFKVADLQAALAWWESFLGMSPVKRSEQWGEFRVGNANLGFLLLPKEAGSNSACVPVLQYTDEDIVEQIAKAKRLGSKAIVEGADHPDFPNMAAVLMDPFGNEFEITSYNG